MTFVPPHGPVPCRIAIVGDMPTEEDLEYKVPFAGPSGRELRRMLSQLGISLDDCYTTLAVNTPVEGEEPSHEQLAAAATRLASELVAVRPNVIVAFGDVALLTLLGRKGVKSVRGAVHTCTLDGLVGTKVVATYSPATIQRQYALRTIALGDLEKALAESTTPDVHHEYAEIWTDPTLADLDEFADRYLRGVRILSADVETRRGQITCVGLAPSRHVAIVVPFWTGTVPVSYWPDIRSEVIARQWVARRLEDAEIVKVHQNGLYDIQYYIAEGMKPRNCTEDTMLAHHSLWSELPKNLEYLGSTFTDFRSWKGIHRVRAEDQLKRDD